MVSLFAWLGIFLIISRIINGILKRPAVNGASWFFWIFLILFICTSVLVLYSNFGNLSEYDRQYFFGELSVYCFFPLLLARILASKFKKKNKSETGTVNEKEIKGSDSIEMS
jgi:hypothetical protein